MDQVWQSNAWNEGQQGMRMHFHGIRVFLWPTRNPQPTSQPWCWCSFYHTPPIKHGFNNTPSASLVDSNLTSKPAPTPVQNSFLQLYDLWLNLQGLNSTIHSKWEGVTNLLHQMQEFDDTIELMTWAGKDSHYNLPVVITSIAYSFFDLHTYILGLASMNARLRT